RAILTRALADGSGAGISDALAALLLLDPFLRLRGANAPHLALQTAVINAALALPKADRKDPSRLGWALRSRGGNFMAQGRMDEARADITLALSLAQGSPALEGTLLRDLSSHYYLRGQSQEAAATAERGIALAREAGDPRLEGHLLGISGFLAAQR